MFCINVDIDKILQRSFFSNILNRSAAGVSNKQCLFIFFICQLTRADTLWIVIVSSVCTCICKLPFR